MTGFFLDSTKDEETRVCKDCSGTGVGPVWGMPVEEVVGRGTLLARVARVGQDGDGGWTRWEMGRVRGKG